MLQPARYVPVFHRWAYLFPRRSFWSLVHAEFLQPRVLFPDKLNYRVTSEQPSEFWNMVHDNFSIYKLCNADAAGNRYYISNL